MILGEPQRRQGEVLQSHPRVRLPPDLAAHVKALADEDGVTLSTWVREAVRAQARDRVLNVGSR